VAATVEGSDEVRLLELDYGNKSLRLTQSLGAASLALPTDVAFDAAGRLWAVGGPLAEGSSEVFLAVFGSPSVEGAQVCVGG
jgi:hypothetical protein